MHRKKPQLVVFTGAGISEESGVKTFRDAGGLWESHDIMEVASISGWRKNPALVLEFYNQRRRQLQQVLPNQAHLDLAEFAQYFDLQIITQNVDDLHERAGSQRIIHLHGELLKARSTGPVQQVIPWTTDLGLGEVDELGFQLRPHIVWFGEEVPMLEKAILHTIDADAFLIIGTSLAVYPAASLIDFVREAVPVWYVDPHPAPCLREVQIIPAKAVAGTKIALTQIHDYFRQNY